MVPTAFTTDELRRLADMLNSTKDKSQEVRSGMIYIASHLLAAANEIDRLKARLSSIGDTDTDVGGFR